MTFFLYSCFHFASCFLCVHTTLLYTRTGKHIVTRNYIILNPRTQRQLFFESSTAKLKLIFIVYTNTQSPKTMRYLSYICIALCPSKYFVRNTLRSLHMYILHKENGKDSLIRIAEFYFKTNFLFCTIWKVVSCMMLETSDAILTRYTLSLELDQRIKRRRMNCL